jgi:FixJ family two-component response regulator
MGERDHHRRPTVLRPVGGSVCIVMVCADMGEADQVGRQLLEQNNGCLVTYRRTQDMISSAPISKVALVILATQEDPPTLRRTLRWLQHRWPKCPMTVVGDEGCGEHEMAAREGGANFLARPVAPQQWTALLGHALGGTSQAKIEGVAR